MVNNSSTYENYERQINIDIFSDETIALTITYICLGVLTLVGNFMVCYLYYKSPSLRTLTNRFVISSSIAGILVGLLFVPFYLVLDTLTQAVSSIAMPVSSFIASLTGFVTLFNVAALTYDRHIAIFEPLRYNELMTKRKTNMILFCVWMIPMILSATPILLANTIKSPEHVSLYFKIYQGFLSTLLCVVISIVFAIYLRIAILTRKHLQHERRGTFSVVSLKSDISDKLKSCLCFRFKSNESRAPTICLDDEILSLTELDAFDVSKPNESRTFVAEKINSLSEHETDAITVANTRRNSAVRPPCLFSTKHNVSSRQNSPVLQPAPQRRRKTSAITNREFLASYTKPKTRKLSLDVNNVNKSLLYSPEFIRHVSNDTRNNLSCNQLKMSKVSFQTSTSIYSPKSLHENQPETVQEMKNESDDENNIDPACRTPLLRRQHRIKSHDFEEFIRAIKFSPDVQRFSSTRERNTNNGISTRTDTSPQARKKSRVLYTLNSDEDFCPLNSDLSSPQSQCHVEKSPACNRRVSIQENKPVDDSTRRFSSEIIGKQKFRDKFKFKSKSLSFTRKSIDKNANGRRHSVAAIRSFGSNRDIGILARIRKTFSSTSNKGFVPTERSRSFSIISDWLRKRGSTTRVFAHARVFLHDVKVAKVLSIIFIINSLCWMPLIFINFADAFGQSHVISNELLMASQLLFMINSLLMPYVYAFCKKDFKYALKKQLRELFNIRQKYI